MGERSGVAPGGGEVREGRENFSAVQTPDSRTAGNQQNLHIILISIIINHHHDNTVVVHGEVSFVFMRVPDSC